MTGCCSRDSAPVAARLFAQRLDPLDQQPCAFGINAMSAKRRHLPRTARGDALHDDAAGGRAGRNDARIDQPEISVRRTLAERAHLLPWEQPVEVHRAVPTAVERVAVRAVRAEVAAGARLQISLRVARGGKAREPLRRTREQRRASRRPLVGCLFRQVRDFRKRAAAARSPLH